MLPRLLLVGKSKTSDLGVCQAQTPFWEVVLGQGWPEINLVHHGAHKCPLPRTQNWGKLPLITKINGMIPSKSKSNADFLGF